MMLFSSLTLALLSPCASANTEHFDRVADYLEKHPDSTLESIDAACNVGRTYQVLADMPSHGYGISSRWCWRDVACTTGPHLRKVKTYTLTHRPTVQTCKHSRCRYANKNAKP